MSVNTVTSRRCECVEHIHEMWCDPLLPSPPLLPGNLLNSLMGSGEDDDGTEEAQEDGSPIELD